MNKTTAIITDVRYRMSLALIRDLKEAGFYIVAVEHDSSTPALGFFSKYADETFMLDSENYKNELYMLCALRFRKNDEKPLLFTVGAKSLAMVSEDAEMFSEVASFCIASPENLALLNDKERLHIKAESLGIPVPSEYKAPYEDIQYPAIVKPVCGEKYGIKAQDRYRIVKDKAGLDEAVTFYEKACCGDEVVVQKYLCGGGYGCSVVAENGKILSSICHERIREYPVSGGPSACCKSVQNPKLLEHVKLLVSDLNFSGVAMFEFKESDGAYYLLECNPRVWGSFPLVRAAKSDFCIKWAQACTGGKPQAADNNCESSDYKEVKMHYLLSDLRAGASYIKSGRIIKGLGAFFDTLNPAVKGGLLEFSDIKPALEYLKRIKQ